MSELLKRENDIVTLKMELMRLHRVRATLQFQADGRLQSLPLWEGGIDEWGLAPSIASDLRSRPDESQFHLPPRLLESLRSAWLQHGEAARPLWVHLVKPYGALRYLPWERLLVDALHTPVLMLPDFLFPPPRESASMLDIAVCASAPLNCEHAHIRDGLIEAIQAILSAIDRPLRLHVFADSEMGEPVRHLPTGPAELILHSPADAERYVVEDPSSRLLDASGTLRSPWLLWMRQALKPYSTDAVHFVCHGHLSGAAGAMLLAQSPLGRSENYLAGPVGACELTSFLTQVGAWATAFSASRDNHNPVGLRALADEIAQSLPGPMLLFNAAYDNPAALAQSYRFVHARTAEPPPQSRALYLYCQPYLLAPTRGAADETELSEQVRSHIELYSRNDTQRDSALKSLPPSAAASATRSPYALQAAAKSISAVTAATERLAEQVQVQYQQVLRDQVIPEAIVQRDLDAAMDTIDLLRQAVGEIEQRRLRGEIEQRLVEIEQDAPPTVEAAVEAPIPAPTEAPMEEPIEAGIEAGIEDAFAIEVGAAAYPQQDLLQVQIERMNQIEDFQLQIEQISGDSLDLNPRIHKAKQDLEQRKLQLSDSDELEDAP
ncbi:hypothetical protein [Lysobacter sp. CA196]|uniref:hypothetical protein n=1 Tax=Lysobacter sp. CA196 TaxID=3455606 RepID=UPI003F8D5572